MLKTSVYARACAVLGAVSLAAFAFIGVASAANAASSSSSFTGSEVLGCAFDSGPWTANSCNIFGTSGDIDVAHFVPYNLSGTYTMRWTVTGPSGSALSNCSSTVTYNCISGGCTSTSTTCDVNTRAGKNDHIYTASLKLTQSGVTKTISASAVVYGDGSSGCPLC
jgi:hypothetical protein